MPKQSAGLLVFRRTGPVPEVLLAHPGGPFWARKDAGAWSVPKGLCEPGEPLFDTARREFFEETGLRPEGEFIALMPIRSTSGKDLAVWAVECDLDTTGFRSNTFRLDWPPRSGQFRDVPEVDRLGWFALPAAMTRIHKGQRPVLEQLAARLDFDLGSGASGASTR